MQTMKGEQIDNQHQLLAAATQVQRSGSTLGAPLVPGAEWRGNIGRPTAMSAAPERDAC